MKSLKDYLQEAEGDKKKTQTKQKDADWSAFDNLFGQPNDANLPSAPRPEPEAPRDNPRDEPEAPQQRRASQADTHRATRNIAPSDDMRNMLNRMRDIETDPDDPGYPEPEQDNAVAHRVDNQNLPAVAGQNLAAAGIQNPDFHQVANLPGNMSRAIRTLGKALFRSFTRTPTEQVYMIGNLGGQGPNTNQEVNAVAGWLRDNGEDIGIGNIDFDTTIPGYQADIRQYSAGGIRWLVVMDEFGKYIYSWPESDSVNAANTPELGNDRPRLPNR
jgi:hypothetical protein